MMFTLTYTAFNAKGENLFLLGVAVPGINIMEFSLLSYFQNKTSMNC